VRTYKEATVSQVDELVCDRCQRRDDGDGMEGQEFISWSMSCGFGSVFGDMNHVDLDLCQHCIKEVLGQWVKVTAQG
jgi:hypothetical protein